MSQRLPNLSTTRRTLLRTTAWSVPAVTLAAAAPAFAGSGEAGGGGTSRLMSFAIWGPEAGEEGLLEGFGGGMLAGHLDSDQLFAMVTAEYENQDPEASEHLQVRLHAPEGWEGGAFEQLDPVLLGLGSGPLLVSEPPSGVIPPTREIAFTSPDPVASADATGVLLRFTLPPGAGRDTTPWTLTATPAGEVPHSMIPMTLTQAAEQTQ